MISVAEALDHLFTITPALRTEYIYFSEACGRILAEPVISTRDQPPFDASAMDGYAFAHAPEPDGDTLSIIGEVAAGHSSMRAVQPGQAVRIFTGAPLPEGTNTVVIQENTALTSDGICILERPKKGANVRQSGGDFRMGDMIQAPCRLTPHKIALTAAMNVARVSVFARPIVALLATGDELVMPGEEPRDDQIFASNSFGLKALFEAAGADVRLLPIARDTRASLRTAFTLADGADLVVSIGGASVGAHDLIGTIWDELGVDQRFYKVAMRPGKPLMAARKGNTTFVGLPGNPVSAMVCGHIFIKPLLAAMQGLDPKPAPRRPCSLAAPLAANGPREHYMRGVVADSQVTAFDKQDSSLLSVLSSANALVVRPPDDHARGVGDQIDVIDI